MIQFRSDSILLLGDTHQYGRTFSIIRNRANIDNYDIVFLGDGGEGFGTKEMDAISLEKINRICKERDIRLSQ